MKICVPILNRQTWGRLKLPLKEMYKEFQLQVIVGGSAILPQYGDIRNELAKEGIKPAFEAKFRPPDDTPSSMAIATGFAINELADIFNAIKPDWVICHADRYETLAVATAASYQNIPLIHHQAGEVSGSIDDKVRRAVSQLSDVHLCATMESTKRVEESGLPFVYNVGCPSLDLIPKDLELFELPDLGFGHKIDVTKPYYLVIYHPDTYNYGREVEHVEMIVDSLIKKGEQVIWMTSNIDAGNEDLNKLFRMMAFQNMTLPIRFFTHLPPETYLRVLANAQLCIGNSSSFIREGSYLGVPAVIIGGRQAFRECASNIVFATDLDKGIEYAIHADRTPSQLYGDGKATERILKVLRDLRMRSTQAVMLH